MPRVVSFIVLVAILLFIGAMTFKVLAQFVLPLFLAAVLVVVFKPIHMRVREQFPGRIRIAALVTTVLIMIIVLLPMAWLGWNAYIEGRNVFVYLQDKENKKALETRLTDAVNKVAEAVPFLEIYELEPPPPDSTAVPDPVAEPDNAAAPAPLETGRLSDQADAGADAEAIDPKTKDAAARLNAKAIYDYAAGAVGGLLLSSVQGLLRLLLGLIIMVLALYYFLVDGPSMIHTMMRLSPLENEYERELLDKFANVSRAVVVAALASAFVQGLLAGAGFYVALNAGAPIFLLTTITMVAAVVPFVGAAGIWIPTCIWIYLYQEKVIDGELVYGDTFSAIGLAIYSACVVSTIDNVIKPLVLHGQSNLHPLLALLSILGGITALGPVGILVGPMLVAFIHALLVMVNKELRLLGTTEAPGARYDESGAPLDPSVVLEAEAAASGADTLQRTALAKPKRPGPIARAANAAKRRRRKK